MEGDEVLDAITHAVAAVRRRREGLVALAGLHEAAARRGLEKLARFHIQRCQALSIEITAGLRAGR